MREYGFNPKINLNLLRKNPYPGRGVVVGINESADAVVMATWIMGRSSNSRNRVYKREGGRIYTALAVPDPNADTALIIYNAMDEIHGDHFVASNGSQTDTVISALRDCLDFKTAMYRHTYEPDAPNYTPRITAMCYLVRNGKNGPCQVHAKFCQILKDPNSDAAQPKFRDFSTSRTSLEPGIGRCITTYERDGSPLPSYRGEPFVLPLGKGIEDVQEALWNALNEENRVALAVKFINRYTGKTTVKITNTHQ